MSTISYAFKTYVSMSLLFALAMDCSAISSFFSNELCKKLKLKSCMVHLVNDAAIAKIRGKVENGEYLDS